MSELVLISRDVFPCGTVWAKDVSVFSNNLQSIFYNSAQERGSIIVVNGTVEQEMWSCFNMKTTVT